MPRAAAADGESIALYGTLELVRENRRNYRNPFDFEEIALRAAFRAPSGRIYELSGFYDGDGSGKPGTLWKVRFAPNEPGRWHYGLAWSDRDETESGSFVVDETPRPRLPGHVAVDPENPRYLIHADGTPHYWWGGKWIAAVDYGPSEKRNSGNRTSHARQGVNVEHKSDEALLAYLDALEEYRHNGLLLKIGLFPLEDDGLTWDLGWIQRGEWLVREAARRGIYVHVNLFDTWARRKGDPFEDDTLADNQVLNVWDPDFLWLSDKPRIRNYIRTVVSRFAGFSNVYWELGNEMEHRPNCGACFVSLANDYYIPWIREADPYDLPIGLSETVWRDADVDIGFLHQTNELPDPSWQRPTMMNELVRGGVDKPLWRDDAMRDPAERIAFRRTFWRVFATGGTGSSEATWLDIGRPLSEPVRAVMADQQRLREFIESLPTPINEMDPDAETITAGPGAHYVRSKRGEAWVAYFLLEPNDAAAPGTIGIRLPEGAYVARWYEPASGRYGSPLRLMSEGRTLEIGHPRIEQDAVLLVLADGATRAAGPGVLRENAHRAIALDDN